MPHGYILQCTPIVLQLRLVMGCVHNHLSGLNYWNEFGRSVSTTSRYEKITVLSLPIFDSTQYLIIDYPSASADLIC